jgi:hypothetical protein
LNKVTIHQGHVLEVLKGMAAAKMGRDAVLIELSPEYCRMEEKRIRGEMGMMGELAVAGSRDE